ncbi:NAD(P)/FAD-dependent oxidoreductase [Streptomyces boninensis]|uniref:FAD/NAD(P)-dependent oxidoreductase n=1 Tax=Streptomyces boninensis TaxID=2039455 RepID=UPI003B20EE97
MSPATGSPGTGSAVVVIGGGPAGMAAARAAAQAGAEVLLVDSGAALGGQYHRQNSLSGGERFTLPVGVEHLAESEVWALESVPGGQRVHVRTGPADSPERAGRTVDTPALVLATGAYDRALPFPGWELPGVFTAGAAQALAKGQGIAVGDRVLLAGTGPFLLPVAESLAGVGAEVTEVLEAGDPVTGWLAAPAGVVAGGRGRAAELARYAALLGRARIPYRRRSTVIEAHGTERVEAATVARLDAGWRVVPGSERRVPVDAVCVGFGFTPQLELAVGVGCELVGGFVAVDIAQATSTPGVFAAGELTGIGGAELAAAEGEIAGTAAAKLLGARPDPPVRALRQVRSGRRFAAALDRAYPVRDGWHTWLRDDTVVCRCEEVTCGELRRAVADRDATGVRSVKLVSRAGLGPCQGRVCGRNVAELTHLDDPGAAFARRPVAAPVRLGELADAPLEPSTDQEEQA